MYSIKRSTRGRRTPVALAVLALAISTVGVGTAEAAPVPVQIGGPTAAAWVDAGTAAGIQVGLTATPANEASIPYATYPAADARFDAPDRDTIGGRTDGPFGLGVDNTLIQNGNPGVTSKPSEIGYYGNPAICGDGKVLANNCADELAVTLDKSLYGGSFQVTFFYGSEQAGETLRVELYRNGVLQDSSVYGPAPTGSYSAVNPGRWTFDLPDFYWDEIRFVGVAANVADASDFLVEFVSGYDRPELGGDTATGSGTRILPKGTWFMYNEYTGPGNTCFDLQAGNPKDGVKIVGEYCIVDNGDGYYTATYDIDESITIGDFEYDIVVLKEHLAVSDSLNFTAVPGSDDNQDFGVQFFDGDGHFYVFAHFSIDYV